MKNVLGDCVNSLRQVLSSSNDWKMMATVTSQNNWICLDYQRSCHAAPLHFDPKEQMDCDEQKKIHNASDNSNGQITYLSFC